MKIIILSFIYSISTELQGKVFVKQIAKDGRKVSDDIILYDKSFFALADGVHQQSSHEFPKQLIKNAHDLYNQNKYAYEDYPVEVLQKALEITKTEGQSTCVMAILNSRNFLRAVVVGNTGFAFYQYQTGLTDQKTYSLIGHSNVRGKIFENQQVVGKDGVDPMNAQTLVFNAKKESLALIYSNGVSDNIFLSDISKIVHEYTIKGKIRAQELVDYLANLAYENSKNKSIETPYSEQAKKQGLDYEGGKEGDISIMLILFEQ